MRVLPPLLLLALPARASEAELPLTCVNGSMPVGPGLVAPAAAAGLDRAEVQA